MMNQAAGPMGAVTAIPRQAALRKAAQMSGRFSVSVLVPALDEAGTIGALLADIPAWIDEVIVVDGHSTDGTREVVAAVDPRVFLIEQTGRGKGDAIKAGLAIAVGDIVVTMDADGSMSFSDAERMVAKLLEGYDFVKGSRSLPGGGSSDFTAVRRLGNWALTRIANVIFGSNYTDITYGFDTYWRRVMVGTETFSDGFQFEIQAAVRAARAGLRTAEVPCFEPARIAGKSKLSPLSDGLAILKVIVGEAAPRRRVRLRAMADLHLAGVVVEQGQLIDLRDQTGLDSLVLVPGSGT